MGFKGRLVKLKEIVDILGDGLHGTPKYSEHGEYYFINGSNLENGEIIIKDNTKKVSEEEFLKYRKNLNDRTIFVSINGTLGNIGTYKNERVVLGKSACYFNVKSNINVEFIKYIVMNRDFQNYIEQLATGTTIKNVSLKTMREYEFFLPESGLQKRIVDILHPIEKKIKSNTQILKCLEEISASIFKRWFVDFEFPNENGEPYKSSGGELVESELGMIPDRWSAGRLTDVATLVMGQSPKSDTYNEDSIGMPLINGASDFKKDQINPLKYTTDPKRMSQKGDFLFGVRATVGNVTYVDKEYALGRGVGVARANNIEYREALYSQLISGIDYLENTATGSVYINFTKSDLEGMQLIIPQSNVVTQYHKNMEFIFEQKEQLLTQNKTLESLRDTLLPKLLSGEIEIPDETEVMDDVSIQ